MSGAKLEQIRTPTLSIACELSGPARGRPTLLLHGWPDDARTWDRVLPALHAAGHRTIVPYLRGCGPTRFRSPETPRNGQLAALGQDVLDLADAMELRSFAVVGHDWGALHPAAQGKRQEFPHGHLGVLQHVMHHRDGAEVVDGDADTFQGLAQRRVHVRLSGGEETHDGPSQVASLLTTRRRSSLVWWRWQKPGWWWYVPSNYGHLQWVKVGSRVPPHHV